MKLRNRRRRITHGVPTILDGYYGEDIGRVDNVQIWAELGLAKGTEESEDEEYHLTNYWLNNADESSNTESKIERTKKRNVNPIVEQTPIRDPSIASEDKSIIAHIKSAENFSLLIEVDDDPRQNGWFCTAATSSSNSDVVPQSAKNVQREQSNDSKVDKPKMDIPFEMKSVPSALGNVSRRESPPHRPLREVQLEDTESSFRRLSIEQSSTAEDRGRCLPPSFMLSKVALIKEQLMRSHPQGTGMLEGEYKRPSRQTDTSTCSFIPSKEAVKPKSRGADFTESRDSLRSVRPVGLSSRSSPNENLDISNCPSLRHSSSEVFSNELIERRKSRLWHQPLMRGESSSDAQKSCKSSRGNSCEESRKRDRLPTDRDLFSDSSPSMNIIRQSSLQSHLLQSPAAIVGFMNEFASPMRKSSRRSQNFVECSILEPKVNGIRDVHRATNHVEEIKKISLKSTKKSPKNFDEVFEVTNTDQSQSLSTDDRCRAQTFNVAIGQSKQNNIIGNVSGKSLESNNRASYIIAKHKLGTTMKNRFTEQLLPIDTNRRISAAFRNENLEVERLSMDGAIDEFRLPLHHPFSTSTPIRPDIVKCLPFEPLENKSLLASIISENDGKEFESIQNSTVDGSAVDGTMWRSHSIHRDSIICSSGYWGIVKKKCSTLCTSNMINKQDISRNLSIHNEEPDRIPFFLNGFPLWSQSYAKKRNFEKELLFMCEQDEALTWRKLKKTLDTSNAIKLGEGSYGEVFTAKYNNEPVAIKIIPIGGLAEAKNGQQHSFRLVLPEVIVSKELTDLRNEDNGYRTEGFIELVNICIARGSYPKKLLSAWDEFHKEFRSDNESPRMFPASQCYLILAYEQGGKSLEDYEVRDIRQAYSIMMQVMVALAVAEERLFYEHRDLHCGNVLISECTDQFREELIASQKVRISMWGACVKIIDFTLSRLKKGTSTIFLNLEHEEDVFEGEGDLQFDIYRLMRKANRNNWARFNPKTNIMWLVYLARYIHKKLEKSEIGTQEERERFVCLFQSMHRFEGSLSEWILYNGNMVEHIVEMDDL